ncbi:MAG: hypothetical protein OSB70_12900 [Myxococcota bacterium]|nr:hypothetical protein [Myxococcota bacterium]
MGGGGEPSPPIVRATGLSGPPIAQESPNPGSSESPTSTFRVPAPSGAPQAAPPVPDRPGFAGIPAAALDAVIDSLRDDEIIAALSTATHMDPEELRDQRALAQRMFEVALQVIARNTALQTKKNGSELLVCTAEEFDEKALRDFQ